MESRTSTLHRQTAETEIRLELDLDGTGKAEISTGLGFLDHMVHALAKHARFDLRLECKGDLQVDDHHTVEDCAIVLGRGLAAALGERRGIRRFGEAHAPLDEALARCVVDLAGRSFCYVDLQTTGESLGQVRVENFAHFFQSLAANSGMALHLDVLRGANDHHRVEAAFKSLALALRQAVRIESDDTPSTKGVLG